MVGSLNSGKKDSSVFSKTSRRDFGDHQVSSSNGKVVLFRRQIGRSAKLVTQLDPRLMLRLNGEFSHLYRVSCYYQRFLLPTDAQENCL